MATGPARTAGSVLLALGLVVGCAPAGTPVADPVTATPRSPDADSQPTPAPSPVSQGPVSQQPQAPEDEAAALIQAASGGDGDSWRDTAGNEYRLGLVNTPETGECFGSQATRERTELTAEGFRADVYETDRFGRSVSVVTTADGLNLNVHLARNGFADDRFLDEFRDENPRLAADLDAAFAAAKAEGKGLWSACGQSPAGPPLALVAPPAPAAADGCHPDYLTCVPVKGTGSGEGEANDLDCGDIGFRVQLRQVGVDPYRLDREGDGLGCEG